MSLNGRGLLLCGDSGAGKSSLSYACARRGWTFVSDDASFLVRAGKGNVAVGNPQHLHFRESATDLFAELRSHELTARINGEIAIQLTTAKLPRMNTALQSQIDFLIFLNRQPSGPPVLRPFSKARASAILEQVICYGEQPIRDAQKAALRDLLGGDVCGIAIQRTGYCRKLPHGVAAINEGPTFTESQTPLSDCAPAATVIIFVFVPSFSCHACSV